MLQLRARAAWGEMGDAYFSANLSDTGADLVAGFRFHSSLPNNMPRSMTFEEWKKGGVRYLKLKQITPAYLNHAALDGFFVGVRRSWRARLLVWPLAPLRREYVIAATTEGVAVLKLRRPGVFRASISRVEYQESAERAEVSWDGRTLTVGGEGYLPIPFHREDAERLAESVLR